MDIDWAKDGDDNQLYIVQARPENRSKAAITSTLWNAYLLKEKGGGFW